MLKLLVVLATAYACVAHIQTDVRTADKTFLTRQKAVYSLFWHVDQPTAVYPELYQIARSWSIEDHIDSFTNPTVVHNFVHIYKQGLIHRDAVFSILHPEHLEEALALYQLLHCAKDFDTFYNTAVWARFNVNERLFTYVLSIVVIHRPDTQHMRTPPFPEIVPHFFFNNEVIQAAHSVKMGDTSVKKAIGIKYHEGGDVVIHANYSGWYIVRDNVEDKLNYFTEDIGLNSNYFTMVNDYPFFLNSQDYNLHKEIRGEQYYYTHKQLLARYYLERLSNDLGEIEHVNWHAPIRAGYYPTINHHNGLPFPHRQAWSFVPNRLYPTVTEVEAIESRIHAAIDSGYILDENNKQVNIYTPEGFNILANIVEGNADSVNVRYYGSFDHICRHVIGFSTQSVDKHHVMPSALEIMSTSMRDPGFYRIYKKILNYFLKYKEHLPKYTHDDVAFPGVKIESVAVDKLLTYFEHHDTIVSNGVPVTSQKDAETTVIKVRQHRLNHKPFTYHITVNSEKNTKALVRVFIGPKFNEHGHELHLADNWMNFVEMDQWVVELKAGINKIERSSHESVYTVPDEQSSDVFWKKITKAIEAGETYTYTPQISGFPDRLVLPKGKKEGLPVKLFVYVSPFDETTAVKVESPVWGTTVTDGKPMGYPLDRPVVPHVINVPNALFKDVVIFHKHVEELNLTI